MADNRMVFIATVLLGLKHELDDSFPTAATNGTTVKYNPEFVDNLTQDQLVFLMLHETWHVAYLHMVRLGDKYPQVWNMAGDYVINNMLVDQGFKMPPNGLQDYLYSNMSTEQVYELLKENKGSGDEDSFEMDIYMDNPGDGEGQGGKDPKEVEEEIKGIIVRAITQHQMDASKEAGNIPQEILRSVEELINPKLDWRQLLARFVSEKSKEDYSWSRPNRRFISQGLILPSQYSESISDLTIAIDTSGSVDERMLTEMLSEINYIQDTIKPKNTTILDFDTEIHNVYHLNEDTDIMSLEFNGGGGTYIDPVFEYCNSNPTKALIVFSDLYFHPYEEEVAYPVMWIVYDNPDPSVPFGEIVKYEL